MATLTAMTRDVRSRQLVNFVARYGTLIVLVAMMVGLALAAPGVFLTGSNLKNILSQISLTAIIACGLTLPLVVGEFDLSVGYQSSIAGVLVVGLMVNQDLPLIAAIVLVLVGGAVIGAINGFLVTKLDVNALVATLGVGTVLIGLNYAYSGGIPISGSTASPAFTKLALGQFLGFPYPVWIMIAVAAGLWLLLNRTVAGQHMQAAGGNRHAAELSGIRVNRVRVLAFVIAGVCAALTGLLLASRIGSGQTNAGDAYLLTAFSAVFLGSAALRDGEFHIIGTIIGVLTVGVGFNGLAILGAPTYTQYIFSGGLLIMAVALSTVARRIGQR